MKAVIDGAVYDTETATKIAFFSKEFGADEFRHVEESLCKTKSGRFFLAGGAGIVVLTRDEARHWCESHGVEVETIARHLK